AGVVEEGAQEHVPRGLALAPRGGLQRARVQAGDFDEGFLEAPHQLERSLCRVLVLERVEVAEPRCHDEPLVDPRVVLHRARAEWVKARVDAEIARRELREMAEDLRLGELPETGGGRAAQVVGALRRGEVDARRPAALATRLRLFEDELHAVSASTSRSMSSGVFRSVTATSNASSRPA